MSGNDDDDVGCFFFFSFFFELSIRQLPWGVPFGCKRGFFAQRYVVNDEYMDVAVAVRRHLPVEKWRQPCSVVGMLLWLFRSAEMCGFYVRCDGHAQ